MVRSKFTVQSITHHAYGDKTVTLLPVGASPSSEENTSFWKATPSGKIEMQISNPNAAVQFEPGLSYYVDFTPVTPAE